MPAGRPPPRALERSPVRHLEREDAKGRASASLLTVASGAVAAAVSVVLAWLFAGGVTRPIQSLRDAVVAFGEGARDVDPHVVGNDELGDDSPKRFGRMATTIREHMAALRVARERLDDIFASIEDGLVVCAADGKVAMANAACGRWAGQEETELVGAHVSALLEPALVPAAGATTRECDGAFLGAGGKIPVRILVSPLRGEAGGHVYVARDLRPCTRERSEARLRQAEKLDAIGRLAGGISHDFNNMLSVILGYSSLLLDGRDPSDEMFEPLQEIRTAGERSADLTRQLLSFSRQQSTQLEVVDVSAGVEQTVKMARRVVGEHIELECRVASRGCRIRMAPGQIEQVLMNLIVNARDAMPEGGELVVSVDRRAGLGHGANQVRASVIITVADTGTGMDDETRAKIFEPFFTTKAEGKGTGLGLATVFGIVSQCGGEIAVDTAPGRGATAFVLSFPESTEALPSLAPPAVAGPNGEPGTILLVEDEPQVRNLAADVLRRQGYTVLVAEEPEESLQICKGYRGRIDMLLTDVVMPRMNGRQVADAVLAMRPEVKVVFASGYSGDLVSIEGLRELGASFLQKPLTPETLSRAVRDAMSVGVASAAVPATATAIPAAAA